MPRSASRSTTPPPSTSPPTPRSPSTITSIRTAASRTPRCSISPRARWPLSPPRSPIPVDMKISTPTATLGIRGTTGLVEVPEGAAANNPNNVAIKLYPDADGRVGRIEVNDRTGARLGLLTQGSSGFYDQAGHGRRTVRRGATGDFAATGVARPGHRAPGPCRAKMSGAGSSASNARCGRPIRIEIIRTVTAPTATTPARATIPASATTTRRVRPASSGKTICRRGPARRRRRVRPVVRAKSRRNRAHNKPGVPQPGLQRPGLQRPGFANRPGSLRRAAPAPRGKQPKERRY